MSSNLKVFLKVFNVLFLSGLGFLVWFNYSPYPQTCVKQPALIEEFSNAEDLKKNWNTVYPPGGGGELQAYTPEQVSIDNGILYLQADRKTSNDRKYVSGIIQTKNKFFQSYGYYEIRARLPQGQGLWPAFWLLPEINNYPNEIDVFEFLGTPPDTIYTSMHRNDIAGNHQTNTQPYQGKDFTKDFHVYAVDWRAESLTWYLDGVQIRKITRGIPNDPMFILVNLAVGGNWPGNPDSTTPFPAAMEVDYVHVYNWDCDPNSLQKSRPGPQQN